MKRQWVVFVAAMTALGITACANGDGIVINGTTAAQPGSEQAATEGGAGQEAASKTKIEIITEETTAPPETSPQPETTEAVSQARAETSAAARTSAAAQATSAARPAPAQTTAAPAQTAAAKKYQVKDVKKTMYATASVRIRSSYSTSSEVLGSLSKDEKIEVTGESENGWMRVNYKGHVGYVSKDYLSEKAPKTGSSETKASTASSGANSSQSKPAASSGAAGQTTNSAAPGSQAAGPVGSSSGSGNDGTGPGSAGSASPAANSSSSGGTGSGGSSVTGTVTELDPSGVKIQTGNGTYEFVWGTDVPALAPGEKIQIFYETTGSGQKRVTSYSK